MAIIEAEKPVQTPEVRFEEDTEVQKAARDTIGSEISAVRKRLSGLSGEEQRDLMKGDPHVLAMRRLDGISRLDKVTVQGYGAKGYEIGENNNIHILDDQGNKVKILSVTDVEGDMLTCQVEGSSTPLKRDRTVILDAQLIGNKDSIATSPPLSQAEVKILTAHIAAINPDLTDEQKKQSQIADTEKGAVVIAARTETEERLQSLSVSETSTPEEALLRDADAILTTEQDAIIAKLAELKQSISGVGSDVDTSVIDRRIAKLEEQQRLMALAVGTEGLVGTVLKRRALATIKSNPGAGALEKKLIPAATEAENEVSSIFKEHGIEGKALQKMEQQLREGDLEGLMHSGEFQKLAKVDTEAMSRLFGSDFSDPKKLEALLDNAGYPNEIKKKILAAGGGLLALVALLVMGPLAANVELIKVLTKQQG